VPRRGDGPPHRVWRDNKAAEMYIYEQVSPHCSFVDIYALDTAASH
jgi:hypothetical protein